MAPAEPVTVAEPMAACRDSNDDKFLELAVSGYADLILSGDADLLVLNRVPRHPDRLRRDLHARLGGFVGNATSTPVF
jgi:predicted nucleic acid-binding protein